MKTITEFLKNDKETAEQLEEAATINQKNTKKLLKEFAKARKIVDEVRRSVTKIDMLDNGLEVNSLSKDIMEFAKEINKYAKANM